MRARSLVRGQESWIIHLALPTTCSARVSTSIGISSIGISSIFFTRLGAISLFGAYGTVSSQLDLRCGFLDGDLFGFLTPASVPLPSRSSQWRGRKLNLSCNKRIVVPAVCCRQRESN